MVERKKDGKIKPNTPEKDCIVVLPDDDYTVIIIKPNHKGDDKLPYCKGSDDKNAKVSAYPKVYKPDMTSKKHNEIVAIAESISPRSNSDSDTDTDGFSIGR